AANWVTSQDDGILLYRIDPNTGNVTEVNESIDFEALLHGLNIRDREQYAVGNRTDLQGLLTAYTNYNPNNPASWDPGVEFAQNLLYRFEADGTPINHPNTDPDPRLTTNYVPVSRLLTAPAVRIPLEGATDKTWANNSGYSDPGDLLDGTAFTINDGIQDWVFEFDCGPDIRLNPSGAFDVRDGEVFTLDDGNGAVTFEFDSGPVLVHGDGQSLVDGDTFAIQDDAGKQVVFEFKDVNSTTPEGPGNVRIDYGYLQSVSEIHDLIIAAINGGGFAVNASSIPPLPGDAEGRITLINDTSLRLPPPPWQRGLLTTSIRVEGDYSPPSSSNNVQIPFEETDAVDIFGQSIVDTVNANMASIMAGYAHRTGEPDPIGTGDRITFYGATTYDATPGNATALVQPTAADTEFSVTAVDPSTNYNGVQIEFVDRVLFRTVSGAEAVDSQTFTIIGPTETVEFELDTGDGWTAPNMPVLFSANFSASEVATAIADAINNSVGGVAQLQFAPAMTDIAIMPTVPVPTVAGVDVSFTNGQTGDFAVAVFDPAAGTLVIDIDPLATTANTVINAINQEGTFTATLDASADVGNDGTGFVGANGLVATTTSALGIAAVARDDIVLLTTPGADFSLATATPTTFTDEQVVGDAARVTFDISARPRMMTIEVDPGFTTAQTVVDAINTFNDGINTSEFTAA
ncbi:MAG TPA: hypothetical protein VE890_11630, partial [Thermoguttaceae bacterium]|nr:hypothetical protein [Thermoguttaceae bacterium]